MFIRGHTREFSRTITYTDNQGLKINFVFLKEDLWKIDAHKNRITQTVHPRYPEKTEWYWKQSGRQGPPLLPQQLKDNDLLWVKSFREALKYAPPEIDKVMKQYDMAYPTIIE
ncbi:MAG: hypothetical protein HGA67_00945 [Candidatus Yonathbacteria bacterium]|nr:hypothetical protein [Candidatus Yonathbacteria bacterium]